MLQSLKTMKQSANKESGELKQKMGLLRFVHYIRADYEAFYFLLYLPIACLELGFIISPS
jgi:hypothetical protein